jgi:hypothetical protein
LFKCNYFSLLNILIGIVFFQDILVNNVQAATPSVARFEWVQSPSEINIPAYFYWDIRNVKECFSMTSGTGTPALKPTSGVSGPATNASPYTGLSRWYCIDLNGNRYPTDPNQFIEAQRIVEAPLTAPVLMKLAGSYNAGLSVAVVQQPGITYRYSLNGSEVNQYAPILNTALTLNSTATLRVRAYRAGFNPSPEVIATYSIVGSPSVQRFEWQPQTVDIYNSSYFYWDIRNVKECFSTTSGSGSPELKSINGAYGPLVNAVPLSGGSKWYCFDLNGNRYPANANQFIEAPRMVEPPLTAPVVTPSAGTYSASFQASVLPQSNLTFRYTLNGSEVTSSSPMFSSPITISSSTNLRVKAFRTGFNPSPEANVYYNITSVPVATPTISPSGGSHTAPVSVSLASTTSGAQTRYTTNGSEVTSTSTLYSGPFMIFANTTVKARSFKAGMTDSAQSSANFVIQAAAPTISPNGGSHTAAVSVSLTSSTVGSQIRFTTNGGDVNATSTLYSTPFTVDSTGVVKAKSFKIGMGDSPQTTASFVIQQSGPQVIYLHTDALGSVIAETDANGNVIKRTEYKPFGESKDK